jgi:hypothetical protein
MVIHFGVGPTRRMVVGVHRDLYEKLHAKDNFGGIFHDIARTAIHIIVSVIRSVAATLIAITARGVRPLSASPTSCQIAVARP